MATSYKSDFSSHKQNDFSWINEISNETLIKILIKKNLIQANELIEMERHSRAQPVKENSSKHHHHSSPLKHFASKHKWSRWLTCCIFGWEWKKAKSSSHNNPDHY